MVGLTRIRRCGAGGAPVAALILLGALTACTASPQPEPPPSAPAIPAPPPPPTPPPVDLGGKWKLSAAAGGSCVMTFGDAPGAVEGSIAPAGGCPSNFFTSRKWTFERNMLIIRDHKGEPLAQLSFSVDHFEGQAASGVALTLSR